MLYRQNLFLLNNCDMRFNINYHMLQRKSWGLVPVPLRYLAGTVSILLLSNKSTGLHPSSNMVVVVVERR